MRYSMKSISKSMKGALKKDRKQQGFNLNQKVDVLG